MPEFMAYFYLKTENNTDCIYKHGRPYWSLDYFKNSMTILDKSGNTITTEPDCIYLSIPNAPTEYRSAVSNSWVHTIINFEADREYMDSLEIPYMTPIYPSNKKGLEQLLFDMEDCHLSSSAFKQDALNAYITLILIRLHNLLQNYSNDYKVNEGDDLQNVRHIVMNSTHIYWTVDMMAALANMSVRGFQRKYKQIYGKAPIADLYDFRFVRAKRLMDSGYSINHILLSCGFKSAQHFSSFFKKRAGVTPTQYKRGKYKT